MQIGGDIVAEESEERGDGKCLITIADHAVVDGVFVEVDAEPCDEGVNGDHPEDSNDTGAFIG